MLTSIKAYVSFLWGIIVLVLLTSTFSFSQGFINYQAFIYEKVTVVQPGSDLVQMLPYANKSASLFIELRNNDSLFFQENHLNLFTDEQGMVVLNIGSKDSILFREIPWSKLIFGKVVLKISWSQTPAGPRTVIDSALLSGSPFSIKSVFTDSSQYAVNSFSARIADSSNMAKKSVYSDTAVFSKNAIQGILLDTTNESLLFPLINGDTLRSSSLAELRINNVSVFRQGTVCQGDSVLLYSGNLADTALFRSYWFSLHNSQRDTLATNVSSLKFVLDSNSRILFGVQRKVAIAGLLNYAEDTLNLKITDFLNLLDSISLDRVFNKSSFCVNDSIILPTWTNAWGTWRILTPRFAKILQGVVKFKSAGHVTLGFFPFNACPFDVFHFNCVARSNSTASIAQSICEGQSFTFGSQVLTSAGTYTRTIPSANGCDSVITLTLSYYPTPNSLVSASGSLNFCRGGQVNLQVNNIAGQQYQWYRNGSILTSATNANFTVTETGNYSVTITNVHGCTATSSSTQVVVYENPVATVSAGGPTTFCQGGSVVLNANLGPGLTYKWLNSGLEITGAVQPSYVATAAGSYALQVTNASGCSAISGSIALGVLPIRSTDTTDTSCQGSRYYFGGQSLSASGPYWDTLVASNGCDSVIMLTLTVVSNNTIALSSAAGTDTQTVTVNTPMTNITYSTSGATGATVSGLPAGVSGSWANNTVTISGTPTATATGTFNYTVTMTGGCTGGTNTATGTIVVNQRSSGPGSSNR